MKKERRIRMVFLEMKRKHGNEMLLLFHVGGYYEAYFSDARTISETLRIPAVTCTAAEIATVRFPASQMEDYRNLLLDAGLSVCVSEVRGASGRHILKNL